MAPLPIARCTATVSPGAGVTVAPSESTKAALTTIVEAPRLETVASPNRAAPDAGMMTARSVPVNPSLLGVPVTVSEAGLGAKIEVPTIDGRALLKVPQGTHSGQRFRLREKGVFNARKGARGDQIVEVLVQSPKVRDERTKEILRELATLNPEDPRAELWTKV